jgi:hypothetical protein
MTTPADIDAQALALAQRIHTQSIARTQSLIAQTLISIKSHNPDLRRQAAEVCAAIDAITLNHTDDGVDEVIDARAKAQALFEMFEERPYTQLPDQLHRLLDAFAETCKPAVVRTCEDTRHHHDRRSYARYDVLRFVDEQLRRVVDITWRAATKSDAVPSINTTSMLISQLSEPQG